MRRILIAGNWKMNGSLAANETLLDGLKQGIATGATEVAVCVPAPYLAQCQDALRGTDVRLGSQDVSAYESGAYTGEISGAMLREFDCVYAIAGHSERRSLHAESSSMVGRKALAAIGAGLTPIVCVGETLAEREAGQTTDVVCDQLNTVLDAIGAVNLSGIVVAYEPVWAIGTGRTATPEMAQEVHAVLRAQIAGRDAAAGAAVRILYGGSMKADNAAQLLAMPDIDGGLIGGASLKAVDFLAIVRAAGQVANPGTRD